MNRTQAVMDAAEYGAYFVHRGLLTKGQLDMALEAVAAEENFAVFIIRQEWVTEEEVDEVDRELDPQHKGNGGNGKASTVNQANVMMNRAEAHQESLEESLDDLHTCSMRILEGFASEMDDQAVGERHATRPLWRIPEEALAVSARVTIGEPEE